MKPYWVIKNFTIATLLLLSTSTTNADEWSGHFSGFFGGKFLNNNDWPDDLSSHFSAGFVADIKKDSWPISISIDLFDTGGEGEHAGKKDLGHTTELHFGLRKIFINQDSKIKPYIGLGVSFMSAEQELEVNNITTTQDGSDVGSWFGGGMYYEINPEFVLGLDVRYSQGEVTLFNKERDVGGFHVGVTGGFQF
jgi:hypothetical protein